MTQTELCARAKISKSSLSEYLSGKYVPRQDKVFILAQALNVDPVWLWGYDVPMESQSYVSPSELQLTGVDKELWELLRQIPEEQKKLILETARVFVNNQRKD
jgi:transcriptional regulator with XRE-family HTH domain